LVHVSARPARRGKGVGGEREQVSDCHAKKRSGTQHSFPEKSSASILT